MKYERAKLIDFLHRRIKNSSAYPHPPNFNLSPLFHGFSLGIFRCLFNPTFQIEVSF